ncbi:MAG: Mov34/MPN/PAD-1 family protein [Gammaproteobacteria bacterium]|nr:Mov34/MPN/PAD-1 family protein [Gammaproteobacteria bacterium]
MEIVSPYRYVVEAFVASTVLGEYRLGEVDFEPAVQCAHLEGMRTGRSASRTAPGAARVEPIWDGARGRPYIEGVRVAMDDSTLDFPTSLFKPAVVRDSQQLIDDHVLAPGQHFKYRVCAFDEGAPKTLEEPGFVLEAAPRQWSFGDASLVQLESQSRRCNEPVWADGDLPVFVQDRVLQEAVELAAAAGAQETGGILLGQLARDAASQDLVLNVNVLMTAPLTEATGTSLRFGPDTFAAVEQLLGLRRRDEIMVGWWHSHPHFCANCPEAQREQCAFGKPFFSEADRSVHRTLFPQAHSLALLVTDLGNAQPHLDLFTWRRGVIEPRGYFRLHSTKEQIDP